MKLQICGTSEEFFKKKAKISGTWATFRRTVPLPGCGPLPSYLSEASLYLQLTFGQHLSVEYPDSSLGKQFLWS